MVITSAGLFGATSTADRSTARMLTTRAMSTRISAENARPALSISHFGGVNACRTRQNAGRIDALSVVVNVALTPPDHNAGRANSKRPSPFDFSSGVSRVCASVVDVATNAVAARSVQRGFPERYFPNGLSADLCVKVRSPCGANLGVSTRFVLFSTYR